jgi:hypothetical protein
MTAASAAVAASAAAAQQRLLQEEEEHLTNYSPEDLAQGWEFKIVRANTAAFRKPEVLQQVCAEEAQSGWVLVEKFDDNRLRFKRPASARNTLAPMGMDPYRTTYGMSQGTQVAIVLGCVFGGTALLLLIILLLIHH